jgi:hypothetical protein
MAGKGKKPEGGVDWGKQYELSPFLSPWEKRLQEEVNCVVPESDLEWAKRKLEEQSEGISNRSGN